MATVTTEPPSVSTDTPLYRISLDLYHGMIERGLLTTYDKVELLDGILVTKTPKGPRHSTATRKGLKSLEAILPVGWQVRLEQPITLAGGPEGADSEPEPDLAVARGGDDAYLARHPGPADVALVVEVADSTLSRYAWSGIPCVWLVNLVSDVIEVYNGPSGPCPNPGYAQRTDYRPGDLLPVLIAGNPYGPIAVVDLLP